MIADSIHVLLLAEVGAFSSGDCDRVVEFYADRSPLFVVSGRTMPDRAALAAACPRLVAGRPPGATREIASEVIHVLGPDAAYSVTEFRLPVRGEPGVTRPQFVTKLWSRAGGTWKIVHVHESVGEA